MLPWLVYEVLICRGFVCIFLCDSLVPRMVRWQTAGKWFSWNQWASERFCLLSPSKGKSLWVPSSTPFLSTYLICISAFLLCSGKEGEKSRFTARLPGAYVRLLGAEVGKESLSCTAIFLSGIHFVCVCCPSIWHLGTLLSPLWDEHISYCSAPSRK